MTEHASFCSFKDKQVFCFELRLHVWRIIVRKNKTPKLSALRFYFTHTYVFKIHVYRDTPNCKNDINDSWLDLRTQSHQAEYGLEWRNFETRVVCMNSTTVFMHDWTPTYLCVIPVAPALEHQNHRLIGRIPSTIKQTYGQFSSIRTSVHDEIRIGRHYTRDVHVWR